MDLFSQFATDDNAEVNGVWMPSPDKKGEFLIARAGNRKYQRLLATKIEENQDVLGSKTEEADRKSDEIMAEILAETILLGWRGDLMYKPAEALGEYSKERAKQMLLMKEFRKWVNQKSDNLDAFRAKAEVAQGNA